MNDQLPVRADAAAPDDPIDTLADFELRNLRASFEESASRFPEGSPERQVAGDLIRQVTDEQDARGRLRNG
jgi:hypothetical protein